MRTRMSEVTDKLTGGRPLQLTLSDLIILRPPFASLSLSPSLPARRCKVTDGFPINMRHGSRVLRAVNLKRNETSNDKNC